MTSPQSLEKFLESLEESLQDLEGKNASLKAIIYGSQGVGKTVAALQIAQLLTPQDKIILYIDSAEGWTSLQNFPPLKKRVKRLTDSRVSTLNAVSNAIKAKQGIFGQVGAVIIDEHTSVFDNDLNAVTRSRAAASPGEKDPDTPSWPDRNTAKNRAISSVGELVRMEDVHLILLGHERSDKDHLERPVKSPAYTPAAVDALCGLVHVVAHMTADERSGNDGAALYERALQVHPTALTIAKTRIGGMPLRVTVKDLIQYATEWLSGERDTAPIQQEPPQTQEEQTKPEEPQQQTPQTQQTQQAQQTQQTQQPQASDDDFMKELLGG